MAPKPLKVIFGGASFNPGGYFKEPSTIGEAFNALLANGVTIIDTARLYGPSEGLIGDTPGHEKFIIDTKQEGGMKAGSGTKEGILADAEDSLKKCKVDQFDIFYLHSPDASIPVEQTLEGVNEAYKKGIFRRFGLSNFTPEEVQEVYDVAEKNGWVKPTVFQGNYNPVARKLESILFPTLRKLGIAFYAYSPLAGGFLTKTRKNIEDGVGRFNPEAIGGLYNKLYNRPSYLDALGEWNDIAEKEGISKAELAYRWVAYHSILKEELGDGLIFGASSVAQIEQTAQGIKKGPLSDDAVKRIQKVWETVEHEAPVDNWQVISGKI